MRIQRGIRGTGARELLKISAKIPDRAFLEEKPDATAITYFFITHAARRAWEAINQQLNNPRGALFWLGGPAGSGKTHFLNYVLGLSQRAGAIIAEPVRNLTIVVDLGRGAGTVEQQMLERLAHELSGAGNKAGPLWRRLTGREALVAALDQASRQGVRGIIVAIDFGEHIPTPGDPSLEMLSVLTTSLKRPKMTLIVASRSQAPAGVPAFTVAPSTDEILEVAIERARHLDEGAEQIVEQAYRTVDLENLDPRAIYPFHPVSGSVLRYCATTQEIPRVAEIVREILLLWERQKDFCRLIYPGDLMLSAGFRADIEMRLGENGRAALERAYGAANKLGDPVAAIARQAVNVLLLNHLIAGATPLEQKDLFARIPELVAGRWTEDEFAEVIRKIAQGSYGAIVCDSGGGMRFNPSPPGGPEVAAFNAARILVCRFDSTLLPLMDARELKGRLARLNNAMADAVEQACRNRELIAAALHETGGELSDDQDRRFADFIALAESGAQALIERGSDPSRREAALKTVDDYEGLASLAALVPRLRAIREYLAATGLQANLNDNPEADRRLVALETECQLLTVAANVLGSSDAIRKFDALEARFQQFKWTYVQYYRSSHESWRHEMEQLVEVLDDARLYLDALRRLDSVPALGEPDSVELTPAMLVLERRIAPCRIQGQLSPDVTPRCPDCGFILGTPSPRAELQELRSRTQRSLETKLARLSQSAVARLIREHDTGHRLEGFLKMTQATQTDALIRVIDDNLTLYLSRLLDENSLKDREVVPSARPVIQAFNPTRIGGRQRNRRGRPSKLPPAGGGSLG